MKISTLWDYSCTVGQLLAILDVMVHSLKLEQAGPKLSRSTRGKIE